MVKFIVRAVQVTAAITVSTPALACTLCHSRVAEDVRARLFEPDFLVNLLAIASPAPILFGAIYLASRNPV